MPYIDATYYTDEYGGKSADNAALAVFLDRATDIIDQLTNYKIVHAGGLTTYPDFVQTQVKKATAAQTEFLILSGEGTANTGGGSSIQSVNLGSFSYTRGPQPITGINGGRTSPAVIAYLQPTGLLYMGVETAPEYLPLYGPEGYL